MTNRPKSTRTSSFHSKYTEHVHHYDHHFEPILADKHDLNFHFGYKRSPCTLIISNYKIVNSCFEEEVS